MGLDVQLSTELGKDNRLLGELVETADGSMTIRHPEHLETYHSSAGAETEAFELYVRASGYLERLESGLPLTILDVGLGLSYNAMATIDAWLRCSQAGDLDIVSLEWSKDLVVALVNGSAPWAIDWSLARKKMTTSLKEREPDFFYNEYKHPETGSICRWTILVGDARKTILSLSAKFNYIWQDPFSPEKNPDMWNGLWFSAVKQVAAEDVVMMSYSVARKVRDALNEAGWQCERFKTPVKQKKQWLRAQLPVAT
jgi:tRNA U34 5-methylaminomethyl-2-thiouridine-forming methyltransferase MnmC